jgi:hypothetical protein
MRCNMFRRVAQLRIRNREVDEKFRTLSWNDSIGNGEHARPRAFWRTPRPPVVRPCWMNLSVRLRASRSVRREARRTAPGAGALPKSTESFRLRQTAPRKTPPPSISFPPLIRRCFWPTSGALAFPPSLRESQRDSIFQPRVARNELPWVIVKEIINPKGVASSFAASGSNPFRVESDFRTVTQGSPLRGQAWAE